MRERVEAETSFGESSNLEQLVIVQTSKSDKRILGETYISSKIPHSAYKSELLGAIERAAAS